MQLLELGEIDKELREYQVQGKNNIYHAWELSRTVLFQMPTGTGKTRLFSSIIKDTQRLAQLDKSRNGVLVLAHRTELIEQIDETLSKKYGVAHGIIKSGYEENMRFPVQVASVQTIVRRLERWKTRGFSYIIIDEAHHAVSPTYLKICETFPDAKILGVTATPCRLSGDALRKLFKSLVLSQPVSDFIDQGYLSPYQYYSIKPESSIQKQLDSIAHFNIEGDYADADMMRICDTNKVRAKIIKAYLKYAKGKKGIVYTINQEHNKHICEEFTNIGVKAKAIDCKTTNDERKKTVADFRAGRIDVICNVNIFSEGFDCPDCEFIQLARPTCSLAMYLQQVGRGLRIHENKSQAVILDNVGSYNKFGLPSANRKWKHHFNGEGQRVTQSVAVGTHDGSCRTHREMVEGDEEMVMIYTGGNAKVPQVAQKPSSAPAMVSGKKLSAKQKVMLESIVSTKKWFPYGALAKLNALQDDCRQYGTAEEWHCAVETACQSVENPELVSSIYHTYKFVHQGKTGICEYYLKEDGECQYRIIVQPIYDKIEIPDTQDRYICRHLQRCGVISGDSNYVIVKCKYKKLKVLNNGMYLVKKSDKVGVVCGSKTIVTNSYTDIKYVSVSDKASYLIASEHGKSDIYYLEGKEVLYKSSRLSVGRVLVDGLYAGFTQSKHAFICNSAGKVLFPYPFSKFGLLKVGGMWEIVFARVNSKDACLLDASLMPVKIFKDSPESDEAFYKTYHLDRLYVPVDSKIECIKLFDSQPVSDEEQEDDVVKNYDGVYKGKNGLWGYARIIEPTFSDETLTKRKDGIIARNQLSSSYAIIGGAARTAKPFILVRVRGTGKQRREVNFNMESGTGFNDIVVKCDIKVGDRLIIKSDVKDIRYDVIATYREIKHLDGGVFAIKDNTDNWGLIKFSTNNIQVIRTCKYSMIDCTSDGNVIFHRGTGRPRFKPLHTLLSSDSNKGISEDSSLTHTKPS